MNIEEWVSKINKLIPSIEDYIVGYQKITSTKISEERASVNIQNLGIEYINNKATNNIIEALIYNTNISQKRSLFSLSFRNKFVTDGLTSLDNLLEFGNFLECNNLYFNTKNSEIWIQEPGTYYYDEPNTVVKGFSNGESFLESIYLIQKSFYEKWYKGISIPENLLDELTELNDDDCFEVINYFHENLVNYE